MNSKANMNEDTKNTTINRQKIHLKNLSEALKKNLIRRKDIQKIKSTKIK